MKNLMMLCTWIMIILAGCLVGCEAPVKETEDVITETLEPETTEVITDDMVREYVVEAIGDAKFEIWEKRPADPFPVEWRNVELINSMFKVNDNTAIINGFDVSKFGTPDDEDGILYVLTNYGDTKEIREVCENAEQYGITKVVVCNLTIAESMFDRYIEKWIV